MIVASVMAGVRQAKPRVRRLALMNTLTASILALVLIAAVVALLTPASTAGALLALGSPFALFANVMASEPGDSLLD